MLLEKGYTVIATDKEPNELVNKENYKFVQAEIIDKNKIINFVDGSKINVLIHCACTVDNDYGSIITEKEAADSKQADRYIYKLAADCGATEFFMLSTYQVYAPPAGREPVRENYTLRPYTVYAKLKAESEKAMAAIIKGGRSYKGAILRLAPVYGKNYIPNLHSKIFDFKERVAFLYREGDYGFSFCCINNLVGFIKAILKLEPEEDYTGVYNIADSDLITAQQIVEFERKYHRLGPVIQRKYSSDSVKVSLTAQLLDGKKMKTDYRYLDLSGILSNFKYDNTKAKKYSSFRWNLENIV